MLKKLEMSIIRDFVIFIENLADFLSLWWRFIYEIGGDLWV